MTIFINFILLFFIVKTVQMYGAKRNTTQTSELNKVVIQRWDYNKNLRYEIEV